MDNKFFLGYVFGALCSKGVVKYSKKDSVYFIAFETSDRSMFDKFIEAWSVVFTESFKVYNKEVNGKQRYVFKIYDKVFAKRFTYNYGIHTGSARWKAPKKVWKDISVKKGFLCGMFDAGSYIRTRIRQRGQKREKIRNIRIVSPNRAGLESIKKMLIDFNIRPLIYSSGKNFCLDIEGKMKLELFQKQIGYLLESKKQALEEALGYL